MKVDKEVQGEIERLLEKVEKQYRERLLNEIEIKALLEKFS